MNISLLNMTNFHIISFDIQEITKKGKWAKNRKYTQQMTEENEDKTLRSLIATSFQIS